MLTSLIVLSRSFDVPALFNGEWDLSEVPENGNRRKEFLKPIIGFEFHEKEETGKIIGSAWYNNKPYDWELKDINEYLIDNVEVVIEDEKVNILSAKKHLGESISIALEATEDTLVLTGKFDNEDFTITFETQNVGTLVYGSKTYSLDRHELVETVPIPDFMLRRGQGKGSFDQLMRNLNKYLPVIYTSVTMLFLQTVMFKCCCGAQQPPERVQAVEEEEKSEKEEEEKSEAASEEEEHKKEEEHKEEEEKNESAEGKIE